MAQVVVPRLSPPTPIQKFLGINQDTSGDTELSIGESPNMVNFRLTENYKLRKRYGYEELFASLGAHTIQGMWSGKVAGVTRFLFAANGNVYNRVGTTNTIIGTLTNAKTYFYGFDNKVYVLNGTDYKSWDGTTFGDVAGYIPLIATAAPPTGGGSANEQINLLTGKKRQTFSGNNTATNYQLAETAITSVDVVKVGGVVQTSPTNYTVNLTTGVVTFVSAPPTGVNNVDIQWTKGTGSRSEITANKFAMFFGGKNDTRVFVYGDGSNRYYYSGLASGVPSAEYFPALNYREVGSDQYAITDIIRQYDRQIIYTNGNEAYYSYYDTIEVSGDVIPDFPTFPLNQSIGNVAPGQCQLIENNPFSIQNGIYEWVATNVRDERNAVYKSKKVQPSLDTEDLTTALTLDLEIEREYWLVIGTDAWVYNYRLDAWYVFTFAHAPTCFLITNNELYFGTANGQIMKFHTSELSDNATPIEAYWEMGFYDFNAETIRKFMPEMWISLKPDTKTSVEISYQTDRLNDSSVYTAVYNLSTFLDANFADWSFLVNYNPQPFRFKIRAKKFVYFKLILENDATDETLTVLSLNLPTRMGSKVK